MSINEIFLKIKKRLTYLFAGEKSVETYFFKVIDAKFKQTTFSYNGMEFTARLKGASDYDVLRQVIYLEEYKIPLSFLKNGKFEKKLIIDAGANIGATSAYFKDNFPDCKIICIEPDQNNFTLLTKNLNKYLEDSSATLYNAGLTGLSNQNLAVRSNFGDGRDWAKSVEVIEIESELKSITIPDILHETKFELIDFLKIDIEGGEKFFLEENTDLSFLDKTRCIALEIHDELGIRNQLDNLLQSHGFILIVDGQTTIGFNKLLN